MPREDTGSLHGAFTRQVATSLAVESDMSDAFACFELTGARVPDVLMSGCSLREMSDLPWRQGAAQLTEDVRVRSASHDRVPQRLTAVAQDPACSLVGVLMLESSQALQNLLDAPPFAAARRDLQIQAMAVEKLVGPFAGLRLEQRVMRERHCEALGTASGLEGESMLPGAPPSEELPRVVTPRGGSLRSRECRSCRQHRRIPLK